MERELMILDKLINEPKEYSFYEIMERSELSREPTYRHLQRLVEKELVIKRRIGNIYLYSINFRNELIPPLLSFLHMKKLGGIERKVADAVTQKLPKNTLFAFMKTSEGKVVVYVVYAGSPEDVESLVQSKDSMEGLEVEYRGMEIRNFRRLVMAKGIRVLRNAKAFFNGERMFREISDVLAEDEE